MRDPSRLVTVPSCTNPTVAPPDCTTLFVLEPVPNLTAHRSTGARTGPCGSDCWASWTTRSTRRHRRRPLVTPLDWAAQGLAAGTPFSLAHTFGQTGPFRPPNVEKRAPGVFFAGSGTVPGVGIPMVLISGRLAADRVATYLRHG